MNVLKGLKNFFFGKEQQSNEEAEKRPQQHKTEAAPTPLRVPPTTRPLLDNAEYSNGGVQGLQWFEARLKVDGDGDCATEFLEESSGSILKKPQVKPADVRVSAVRNGNVQLSAVR